MTARKWYDGKLEGDIPMIINLFIKDRVWESLTREMQTYISTEYNWLNEYNLNNKDHLNALQAIVEIDIIRLYKTINRRIARFIKERLINERMDGLNCPDNIVDYRWDIMWEKKFGGIIG